MTPDPSREMLLALAIFYGIHTDVAEMLKGQPSPRFQKLGPMLRQARHAQELTLPEIHERCGVSRSQLSLYETGRSKNPGLRTLQLLAFGYRLPFARILLAALQDC